MPFIEFEGANFTVIIDGNGEPWWIAREIFDYLERCRTTLLRQAGSLSGKWHLFL
jgi:hypothetical protein